MFAFFQDELDARKSLKDFLFTAKTINKFIFFERFSFYLRGRNVDRLFKVIRSLSYITGPTYIGSPAEAFLNTRIHRIG